MEVFIAAKNLVMPEAAAEWSEAMHRRNPMRILTALSRLMATKTTLLGGTSDQHHPTTRMISLALTADTFSSRAVSLPDTTTFIQCRTDALNLRVAATTRCMRRGDEELAGRGRLGLPRPIDQCFYAGQE